MHYVYLEEKIVVNETQIDPFFIYQKGYASLFIEAPDDVTFGWQLIDGEWFAPYVPPIDWPAVNKAQAQSLLQATDWTATVDINNPQYSNPYLMNQDEFLAYRSTVRAIAVNPPDTEVTNWPTLPTEVWSS